MPLVEKLEHSIIVVIAVLLAFYFHPTFFNLFKSSKKNYEVSGAVELDYVGNFYLWTRYTPKTAEDIFVGSAEHLASTHFVSKKTYIIIHGFTSSALEDWILKMKDALLRKSHCNVIVVNWDAGQMITSFYVIQARVPGVGKDLAKLLNFLHETADLEYSDVHLIGHSLGAHIAGISGYILKGQLAQITGLDPAGLHFNNADEDDRLDSSDAVFVNVIHTNGCYTVLKRWTDCYGTYRNIGHVDVWVNGGKYQPACSEDGDGETVLERSVGCHHCMSYVYYTESIFLSAPTCYFLTRACWSWEHYIGGSCPCNAVPQYLGFIVNSRQAGVFYVNASAKMPYASCDTECAPLSRLAWIMIFLLVFLLLSAVANFLLIYWFSIDCYCTLKQKLMKLSASLYNFQDALCNQ